MKKYFFLFFIIILFFLIMKCSSDKNPLSGYEYKYEGIWRWIRTTGFPVPEENAPKEGLVIIIQFDDENEFTLFRNDTLKVNAQYKIEKTVNNIDRILYTNIVTYNYHFNREYEYPYLHGDTLEIWDRLDDGYTRFYVKE